MTDAAKTNAAQTGGPKKDSAKKGAAVAVGGTKRRRTSATARADIASLESWFAASGWSPFPFQRTVWRHIARGDSGLLHAATGTGKTLAVWLGALLACDGLRHSNDAPIDTSRVPAPPLTVLWITPMRALAADTLNALRTPLSAHPAKDTNPAETAETAALVSHWSTGLRTGDTPSAERARQDRRMPTALVTTPESVSLMLSRSTLQAALAHVQLIVVDEWHELIGNKRGVQVQLAIARFAELNPALQVWGLSATLGDLDIAQAALLNAVTTPQHRVQGDIDKTRRIDTLIPATIERFPWAGHLGTRLVEQLANDIDQPAAPPCAIAPVADDPATHRNSSTLIFTNTRAQAERWYQALLAARPEWAGLIALHHGSLDQQVREWVESALKTGQLKVVVCTSSLDLGVDFSPVDRVFQVGSPKGIARLLQRAGRSGHAPGRPSRVTIVPTHALELLEAAAARQALAAHRIETRIPPVEPLDVLVQHLVTIAAGTGFTVEPMRSEIRRAWSFRHISDATFAWALQFVERGGSALGAYPDYHRVVCDEDGIYRMPRPDLLRRHRANIGTIVADAAMRVEWLTGGRIGSVEESFISRLRPGDVFTFGGRVVELVRVREMTAYVKRASSVKGTIPQWQGGRMPLSSELADSVLELLGEIAERAGHPPAAASRHSAIDVAAMPEVQALAPLLGLQQAWSALPRPGMLLLETIRSREGYHLFCYAFAGRTANTGLAALLAWRAAQHTPRTFSISVNDYGFELLSADAPDWTADQVKALLTPVGLAEDIVASLNASELALRRFREIARISGLIFQSHPGERRTARQLQASAGLFYEVFARHDPDNLLLAQARSEILLQELDIDRIREALQRFALSTIVMTQPPRPTPFAFPLMVGRLGERISTEKLAARVQRMLAELERAAVKVDALHFDAPLSRSRKSRR